MWIVLVLLVLVALVLLVLQRLRSGSTEGSQDFPFQKRPVLLTPAERSFLGVLEQAAGSRFRVQVQVRLADLMTVRGGLPPARRMAAQNRINGKHADFVLCQPDTMEIVAAIELDDASHQKSQRQQRDRFLEQACEAAGLPLLRFEAKAGYSVGEVRGRISQFGGEAHAIAPGSEGPALAASPSVTVAASPGVVSAPAAATAVGTVPSEVGAVMSPPACPRCGGVTVLRQVKQGPHAGKQLWGCQRYPACRGIVPVA